MVCIIDDREDVWNYATNLIHVKPYTFFRGTADINAPQCLDKAGAEEGGKGDKAPARKARVVRVPKNKPHEEPQLPAGKTKQRPGKGDECSATNTEEVMEHDETNADSTSKQTAQKSGLTGATEEDKHEGGKMETQTESETGPVLETYTDKKVDAKEESSKTELKDLKGESATDKSEMTDPKEESNIIGESDTDKSEMTDPKEESSIKGESKTGEIERTDLTEESSSNKTEPKDLMEESCTDETESPNSTGESGKDKTEIADNKGECSMDTEEPSNGTHSLQNKSKDSDNMADDHTGNSAVASSATEKTEVDSISAEQRKEMPEDEYEEMIEWEDDDDYLLYLENVLQRIHTAFYKVYDQLKQTTPGDTGPDLKSIIPYVRKKVLKGFNIVFSGMFPTNQPPEKSRAYCVATALGANIQPVLVARNGDNDTNATTHMVAARVGTSKVNSAKKFPGVHVVNANWLWCCSERWEAVDERLFPLTEQTSVSYSCNSPDVTKQQNSGSKRKTTDDNVTLAVYDPVTGKRVGNKKQKMDETKANGDPTDAATATVEDNVTMPSMPSTSKREQRFSESYNPLYAFSKDDIASMDKEVEEIFDESESSDSENELRRKVLGRTGRDSSSSEADSLSGEFPRGWKCKRGKHRVDEKDEGEEGSDSENVEGVVDENSRDTSEDDDFNDSIGSVDEEMAAAVEKEFLSM